MLRAWGWALFGVGCAGTDPSVISTPLDVCRPTVDDRRAALCAVPELDGSVWFDGEVDRAGPELRVGVDAPREPVRAFLTFDLTPLWSVASPRTVMSAQVVLREVGQVGAPFTWLGDPWVWRIDYGEALEAFDYGEQGTGSDALVRLPAGGDDRVEIELTTVVQDWLDEGAGDRLQLSLGFSGGSTPLPLDAPHLWHIHAAEAGAAGPTLHLTY